MFSSREAFENDFCPVRDELLGEMYRANENGLPQLVASVSSDVRAMLALFCYRRSHLYALALSIAADFAICYLFPALTAPELHSLGAPFYTVFGVGRA